MLRAVREERLQQKFSTKSVVKIFYVLDLPKYYGYVVVISDSIY